MTEPFAPRVQPRRVAVPIAEPDAPLRARRAVEVSPAEPDAPLQAQRAVEVSPDTPMLAQRVVAAPTAETDTPTRARVATIERRPATPVETRTVIALPDPTFDSAVSVIIGQKLDLRGVASPKDGWLTPSPPGTPGEIGLSAFGTTFFGMNVNARAANDWQKMAWAYEDIDHEVFQGRFGLIDVGRLRAAEQAVNARAKLFETGITEIQHWVDSVKRGDTAGDATEAITAKLQRLVPAVTAVRDQLTMPPPPLSAKLHAAAEALTEFARQLSYIWWESNTVLLNAADDGTRAVSANIGEYMARNGLLADSPDDQPVTDPAAGAAQVREVLSRYSSDAAGKLLPGMDPIAGDLTQPAVWAAANASITKMITTELDKLDAVARTQVAKLAAAYQAVTDWFKANPPVRAEPARLLNPVTPRQQSLSVT